MNDQPLREARGGDPLSAMYFVAAVAMGLAAIVIVAMIFLPSDLFSRRDRAELWVPGSGEAYPHEVASPARETPQAAAAREELHDH